MASVFELANLSGMAYDSTKTTFSNWIRKGYHGSPSGKGFFCEFYLNVKNKEAVLSIRGTDGDNKDWSDFQSDIELALGRTPSQIRHALVAYDRITELAKKEFGYSYDLYLTGHSLGGGLASLLSAKKAGRPTVTFNAPGMQRSFVGGHLLDIIGKYNLSFVNTEQMLHIRATGDPVSVGTGKHMGKVEEVYVDHWGDGKIFGSSRHLAQHSMDNMISTLKNRPWFHKDLDWKS